MAIIKCPHCGNDVSDKATSCIHCGSSLVVEPIESSFVCPECKKNIPIDSSICPFYGCPIETTELTNPIASKESKYIIFASIVFILVIALIFIFNGPILSSDENLAYKNAVQLKSMLRDPDSFKLYDDMFLIKVHREDIDDGDYTYTLFKYGGSNAYGAIITDQAVFVDDMYLMDYSDIDETPDKSDEKYIYILQAQIDFFEYQYFSNTDKDKYFETIDINIDKIKKKMDLQ